MARPCARRRPAAPSRAHHVAVGVLAGFLAFALIALVDTLAAALAAPLAWGIR